MENPELKEPLDGMASEVSLGPLDPLDLQGHLAHRDKEVNRANKDAKVSEEN